MNDIVGFNNGVGIDPTSDSPNIEGFCYLDDMALTDILKSDSVMKEVSLESLGSLCLTES